MGAAARERASRIMPDVDTLLAAVQMAWSPDDYASADAFAARVLDLTRRATEGAEGVPTLVAFPELVGLPLLLTAAGDDGALRAPSIEAALVGLARRHVGRWHASAWRHRRFGLGAIYATYGVAAARAYRDAFVAAARATGATIVAGSAFLPEIDEEPSAGLHIVDGRARNVSLVVDAGGVIGWVAKVHLTPGRERRVGLERGRVADLHPFETPVGRVGVAVCLDAFFEGVVGTLDGRGAQVLVQPSANDAPWDRPWPGDPARREGDVWLEDGLRARLQGRSRLRYGVNPMMVGDLLGMRPRGRSSIVANVAATGLGAEREPLGVLAIAPDAEQEAIVRVRVPHPG
jgi:predicted amidohydrolase